MTSIILARPISKEGFHDMREMQWPDGYGSFTGHAGKLSTDVDTGPSVSGLRQSRGPNDPSSTDAATHSESQTAHDTLGLGEKGSTAGGSGITRL